MFAQGGVYSLAQLANQGMAFFLLPMYGRLLSDDEFGVISLMGAVGTFLGLLFAQGLHAAWFRLRFEEPDDAGVQRFEATITWYLFASVTFVFGVLLVFAKPLAHWVTPNVPFYPLGFLTSIYAAVTVFVTLYERKLQAQQRAIAFAIFSGARALLMLVTIVVFVAGLRWGALGKIKADAYSAIAMAIVAVALVRPGPPTAVSGKRLIRSLGYGISMLPYELAMLANNLIDRMLINLKLGLAATGSYAMGYRLGSVGLLVATALHRAYAPLFIATVKEVEAARLEGDEVAAQRGLASLAQTSRHAVALTACVSLGMTAVARELLLLVAPTYTESWRVVALVAAGILAWSCYYPFSQAIAYNTRRAWCLAVITVTSAAINIGGNLLLIPRWGVMGAAWATLVSSVALAVMALVIGQMTTPLPYRWGAWFVMLATSGAGLIGLWAIDVRMDGVAVRLATKILVAVVAMAVCVWADRLTISRRREAE